MYTVQMYHFLDFLYLIKIYTLYRCTIFLIFLSCWFLYFFTLQENKSLDEFVLWFTWLFFNERLFSFTWFWKPLKSIDHWQYSTNLMTNKNYSPSGHSVIKLSQYKFPTRTLQSSNQNTLYIIHWWLFFDWLFLKYKNKKLYSIDLSLCVRPGQPHNPKNLKITIWM